MKKWGEGQGIITGYEGLKIAQDLIPGIIYSSKTSRLCTGCVNMVPSALPRLIQSPTLSLAVLPPRLKTEVGTISGGAQWQHAQRRVWEGWGFGFVLSWQPDEGKWSLDYCKQSVAAFKSPGRSMEAATE